MLSIELNINDKETNEFFLWCQSLGLNPQWVKPSTIKSEDIKVCPMGPPDPNFLMYMDLKTK